MFCSSKIRKGHYCFFCKTLICVFAKKGNTDSCLYFTNSNRLPLKSNYWVSLNLKV